MVPDNPRVFVFTYDRFDSITTSMMLEEANIDHIVLCHTEEQKQQFISHGRVREDRIIATGQPRGLAYNRNFALDMMADGEWAMFFVDDLKKITELDTYDTEITFSPLPIDMGNSGIWRPRFRKEISMNKFMERAVETARHSEKLGGHLAGFAGIDNALYRTKKWAMNTLADGRAWMVQKTDLRFDENVQLIDDLCWTALNVDRFGVVVNNLWVLPDCRRYTKGAFGSIEQRMPQKIEEAAYLVKTYPHLITFKKKTGWPEGSHVVLKRAR
jgi:hypothetical protein